MDIHKPHAAKTWKEFFIELGTVVLGILIALSLEQAVENWREHRQYLEAREAMRVELASNMANFAYLPAISACTGRRLADIGLMLDKAEKHQAFDPPSWIGEASSFRFRFSAESEAARSVLFSPEEQRQFATVYSFMHDLLQEMDRERQAWARLQALEGRNGLPPEMVANLREAQAEARYQDRRIDHLMGLVRANTRRLSLPQLAPNAAARPPEWPLCLPITTPRGEALRRIIYPGTQ
jgi:hypothetical protein